MMSEVRKFARGGVIKLEKRQNWRSIKIREVSKLQKRQRSAGWGKYAVLFYGKILVYVKMTNFS